MVTNVKSSPQKIKKSTLIASWSKKLNNLLSWDQFLGNSKNIDRQLTFSIHNLKQERLVIKQKPFYETQNDASAFPYNDV